MPKKLLSANNFLITVSLVLLAILLYWRFNLSLTRYFDIDEYAHLHWGYNLFIGRHPYVDFFYLFPPFFLYAIGSVYELFGRSINAVIQARTLMYFVLMGNVVFIFLLSRRLRGLLFAAFTIVVFLAMPLPADKMLEIRPDNIALLFSLAALYLFMVGCQKDNNRYFFLSGLLSALSLGFVPKTVFFLLPPLLVLGLWFVKKRKIIPLVSYIAGSLLVMVLLFVLIVFYGKPVLAIYSMTQMSSSITALLGQKFFMRPDLFFYPNDTYYGIAGYSFPYLANLFIYIPASLFAIWKMVKALSYPDNKKSVKEFLWSASFFVNLFAFVYLYPLKHAQYLLTIAPFIAFYFADFIFSLSDNKYARLLNLKLPVLLAVLIILFVLSKTVYEQKINWTNQDSLTKMQNILSAVPANQPIFDLTGETVFYPDGYYFCCLPYGQYYEALKFPLPPIQNDMEKRQTQYVHLGYPERINALPPYQARYILETYTAGEQSGLLKHK